MITKNDIRPVGRDDLSALKDVIEASDLFPADLLDGMIATYLQDEGPDIWLTWSDPAQCVAYCAPEPMTEGTWNLYLIAVHPDCQSSGVGQAILSHLEETLKARGARLLLVETSGSGEFDRTRDFYRKAGFLEEARLREFYQEGEDKIIFTKLLSGTR